MRSSSESTWISVSRIGHNATQSGCSAVPLAKVPGSVHSRSWQDQARVAYVIASPLSLSLTHHLCLWLDFCDPVALHSQRANFSSRSSRMRNGKGACLWRVYTVEIFKTLGFLTSASVKLLFIVMKCREKIWSYPICENRRVTRRVLDCLIV